jgi:hypothetical protein
MMKFLHLLAVFGVVGLKFAAAVTCENESDPDEGVNGNWCVSSPPCPDMATTVSSVALLLTSFPGAAVMMEPAGTSTLNILVSIETLLHTPNQMVPNYHHHADISCFRWM